MSWVHFYVQAQTWTHNDIEVFAVCVLLHYRDKWKHRLLGVWLFLKSKALPLHEAKDGDKSFSWLCVFCMLTLRCSHADFSLSACWLCIVRMQTLRCLHADFVMFACRLCAVCIFVNWLLLLEFVSASFCIRRSDIEMWWHGTGSITAAAAAKSGKDGSHTAQSLD